MLSRFVEALIAHCSPTLAGHKCGSLFSYQPAKGESVARSAQAVNAILTPKGAAVTLLKGCGEGCLVYVYRPKALQARLNQPDVRAFLSGCGYGRFSVQDCLALLGQRIHCGEDFPHEIGVFLDYPLADVIGFILYRGQGCRVVGCWKAYANEADARRRFALYHKCRRVYLDCYRRGIDVARLTVAA